MGLPPAPLPLDMLALPLEDLPTELDLLLDMASQSEDLPTELDLLPDMASLSEGSPMELSELLEFHSPSVAMVTLLEHLLPSQQCRRKLLTVLLLLPLKILYYF